MFGFLLAGLAGYKLFRDVTDIEVQTGVRCKLCGWVYRVGESYRYSQTKRDECARMFKLHVRDRHPHLLTKADET